MLGYPRTVVARTLDLGHPRRGARLPLSPSLPVFDPNILIRIPSYILFLLFFLVLLVLSQIHSRISPRHSIDNTRRAGFSVLLIIYCLPRFSFPFMLLLRDWLNCLSWRMRMPLTSSQSLKKMIIRNMS